MKSIMHLVIPCSVILLSLALGQTAPPADFLIYQPAQYAFAYSTLLTSLGKTVTEVGDATWSAMTVDDFKQYRAIVFPDPNCNIYINTLSVPENTRAVWSQAVDGNIIVLGTDEYRHWDTGKMLAQKGMLFAGDLPGKTGLYVSLSCYYAGLGTGTRTIPLLDQFATSVGFTAVGINSNCFNDVHIVATDSVLAGLTDAILSNWYCSVHNAFRTYPPEFIPLAIANTGLSTDMAFADGSYGIPYIIARGENLSPLLCGDGIIQSTEACDDGNAIAGDGCSEKCKIEIFCGELIVNQADCAECTIEPVCGNDLVDCGEQCDDGNLLDNDGCTESCILEICGDEVVQPSEECDDGNLISSDGCSSSCKMEFCGDGVVQNSEECDDSNNDANDGCNEFCKVEFCGDGVIQTYEECDDANYFSNDGCSSGCRIEFCGDGVTQFLEECDDYNNVSNDGCSDVCKIEFCGDGIINGVEECDFGSENGVSSGCVDCIIQVRCGNGRLEAENGEECDDGNNFVNDGCNDACKLEYCGDGIVQISEECDDSNAISNDGCSENCKVEFCGDGVVNGVEQCDLGSGNGIGSGCVDCLFEPVCGNGILELGEGCDDGNDIDGDGCSSDCSIENHAPDCTNAQLQIEDLWPADGRFEQFSITGVTDVDGDEIVITVTAISQNEETKFSKTDKNCPDASLSGFSLRVEREDHADESKDEQSKGSSEKDGKGKNGKDSKPGKSGSGKDRKGSQSDDDKDKKDQTLQDKREKSGRTYKITFTADDGKGGKCTGVLTACVPVKAQCACKTSAEDIFYDSLSC